MDDADPLSLLVRMFAACPTAPLCLDIVTGPPAQASFRSSNSAFWCPVEVATMEEVIAAMKRVAGMPSEDAGSSGSGALMHLGHHLTFNLCPQIDGLVVTVQHFRPRAPVRAADPAPDRAAIPVERKHPAVARSELRWTRLKALLRRLGLL